MLALYLIVFLFYLKCDECFAFLNEEEENITMTFMKKHDIRNWILVDDFPLNLHSLNKLKNWGKLKISFLYLSEGKIAEYFLKESSQYINTLIVFKVFKMNIVTEILNYLLANKKYGYFYMFKWIVFTEREFSVMEELELQIPYDCLFLVVYPKDNFYYLKEIYQVKGRVFSFDYGWWRNDSGLIIKETSIYTRRFDFNGTLLVLQNDGIYHCAYSERSRDCVNLLFLLDYARLMNIRLTWVPLSLLNQEIIGDVFHLAYSYDFKGLSNELDFLDPFFEVLLNWYIKRPSSIEQADYYIRPFAPELWLSIFGCLLAGIIFGIILGCSNKWSEIQLVDLLFLAFENICNQNGARNTAINSYRIAAFMFRFFSLFIMAAYSGTILSSLAVRKLLLPFESIDELVENGKYSLGVLEDSFAYNYFRNNEDPIIREIYENHFLLIENATKVLLETKLCNEMIAFAALENDINGLTPPCEIYRLKNPITHVLSTIMVWKHNPFTKVFNYIHIRYYSSGIQKKLDAFVRGQGISFEEISFSYNDVPGSQMVQVLSIVPIGIVSAITILLWEIFWACVRRRKESQRNLFFNSRNKAVKRRKFRNVVQFYGRNNLSLFLQNYKSFNIYDSRNGIINILADKIDSQINC